MNIVLGMALAAAAGWNAFLPLLALAFAHRLSGRIPIASPWTFIASNGGLIVLLALLPVELFGDKAPGWDAQNDRLGMIYRPIAGALIMLATTKQTGLPGVLAALIGAALALGMHLLKVRYRRPLVGVMAGIPIPVASARRGLRGRTRLLRRAACAGCRPRARCALRTARMVARYRHATQNATGRTRNRGHCRATTLTQIDSRCILSPD